MWKKPNHKRTELTGYLQGGRKLFCYYFCLLINCGKDFRMKQICKNRKKWICRNRRNPKICYQLNGTKAGKALVMWCSPSDSVHDCFSLWDEGIQYSVYGCSCAQTLVALLESLHGLFLQWFCSQTTPAAGFCSTNLQDWLVWMRKPTFPEVSQGAQKPRS